MKQRLAPAQRSLAHRLLRFVTAPPCLSLLGARMRGLLGIVLLAIFVGIVARGLVAAPQGLPRSRSFPDQVLSPGELPALWVFVRAECVHCRQHLQGLATALSRLPEADRARIVARLHIVGDLPFAWAQQHPRSLHDSLAIRSTPLTWWVASDASIRRSWLGARDETAWGRALVFVLHETGQP